MFEVVRFAVTGVNIVPTALLGLIVLYWLTVILGALDIDFFDFDLEGAEGDSVSGPLHGILAFLNVAELPFMLVCSIFILIFWIFTMVMHIFPFENSKLASLILFIPNLIMSVLVTKVITQPLKGICKDVYKTDSKVDEVGGKLCTLLCDLTYGRLGQAEVKNERTCIVINVKLEEEMELRKGEKAIVLRKDPEKNLYFITKFEGVS